MDFEGFKSYLRDNFGISLSDEQLNQFRKYLAMLQDWGNRINLTSILDEEGILVKHFIDSLFVAKFFDFSNKFIADAGSGAGLPGIALAIVFPSAKLELIEATGKKRAFLSEVARECSLNNVTVVSGRLEERKDLREHYDFVLARALAKLDVAVELTAHLIKIKGYLLAYKGPSPEEELNEAKLAIKDNGLEVEKIERYELPDIGIKRTIVVFKKVRPTPKSRPRPFAKIIRKVS